MRRCAQLGVPYLVMHPGAHMGAGEEAGLKRIAQSLDLVRERVGPVAVKVLLETTAGQGTVLGHHFAQLAEIRTLVADASWLGVCLDTCHAFAAGYDIRTPGGYAQTWDEFERVITQLLQNEYGMVTIDGKKTYSKLLRHFYGMAGVAVPVSDMVIFRPSVLVKYVNDAPWQMDRSHKINPANYHSESFLICACLYL